MEHQRQQSRAYQAAAKIPSLAARVFFGAAIFQIAVFRLRSQYIKETKTSPADGFKQMMSFSPSELSSAIRGDEEAVRHFVHAFSPLIQVRIGRVLLRYKKDMSTSQIRQETEDLCQETFVQLFTDGARVLQSWDAHKGLSLTNFIGLIAERVAFSWARTGRKNAWREMAMEGNTLERKADRAVENHFENRAMSEGASSPESQVANRETLERVIVRFKAELPPNGLQVFYLIYLQGKTVEEVSQIMNIQPDTVYSWRSRLMKRAKEILLDLSDTSTENRAGAMM